MKNRHLIDNAIFNTTYAVAGSSENHRSQVDEFIKGNLMAVIEDAFDQIDQQMPVSEPTLRTENLEIDLGEIELAEYRQQMPKKLLQGLLQALNDLRPVHGYTGSATKLPEAANAAQALLFYFLHRGYLPWYAHEDDADNPDTLDTILLESIEQAPQALLEFMIANVERDDLLQRLVHQFSSDSLQQLLSLLATAPESGAGYLRARIETLLRGEAITEITATEALLPVALRQKSQFDEAELATWGEPIDSLHRQFITALLSAQTVHFEPTWSGLLAVQGQLLERTLRYYGQQLQVRRQIVAGFTATMRVELLRLLEADELGWLQFLMENAGLLLQVADVESAHQYRQSEMWEYLLGYLLVERGRQFDRGACLRSLVRQTSVSSDTSEALLIARFKHNLGAMSETRAEWPVQLSGLLETIDSFESGDVNRAVDQREIVVAIDQVEQDDARGDAGIDGFVEGLNPVGTLEASDPVGPVEISEHLDAGAGIDTDRFLQGVDPVEATDDVEPRDAFDPDDRAGFLTGTDLGESDNASGSSDPDDAAERPRAEKTIGQDASVGARRSPVGRREMGFRQGQSYRRYERVKAALTVSDRLDRTPESALVTDIKKLQTETPWLLQRLYRELQIGNVGWVPARTDWSADLLAEFCYALLSLNSQVNRERPYGLATELVMTIQRKAAESANRKGLFIDILERMIAGETIDLDTMPTSRETSERLADQARDAEISIDHFAQPDTSSFDTLRELADMSRPARMQMLLSAELLTTAAYLADTGLVAARLDAGKWQFIRAYVTDTGYLFNERFFVRRYFDHLVQQERVGDPGHLRESLVQGLLQNSLPATASATQRLIEALSDDADDTPRFIEPEIAEVFEVDDEPQALEEVYIANAGMVLLAPYLPRLFDQLGYTSDQKFKSRDTAERAVHCLQFLVNSSSTSPEYQLVLNKLLCGIKPGFPICRGIELSGKEREHLEGLLKAVTQHWKALRNTSIEGLRESFLQRNGRLQLKDESWQLSVETKAFDMLLDQVPWSFNTIKFAWMDRIIFVEWQ